MRATKDKYKQEARGMYGNMDRNELLDTIAFYFERIDTLKEQLESSMKQLDRYRKVSS